MTEYQRVTVEEVGDFRIVRFRDLQLTDNWEIENLGRELYSMVEQEERKHLILDFSSVQLLSSAAFGKLISLHGKVRTRGGVMKLCNIRPELFDAFRICQLDRFFDISKSLDDAMAPF
jgi:anti-sigma B factor antagonist